MSLGNQLRKCEEVLQKQREEYENRLLISLRTIEDLNQKLWFKEKQVQKYAALYGKWMESYTDPASDLSILEDREHPLEQSERLILL